MIKEGKIGIREAVWLTIAAISSKVFFSSPAVLAGMVGTTGWYATLISASVALLGFAFIYHLLKRFPDKEIDEIFELSLGRVVGTVFTLVLALTMLYIGTTRLSEFSEVMRVYVFPSSPDWYLKIIYMLCVFVLSWLGLETIARVTKLFAYVMLIGFFLVLLLAAQNYDINNLFPIFGYGLDTTVINGVLRSSAYGEVIILAIFAKSFQGIKFIKKEGVISLALSAFFISVSILAFSLTFPYTSVQETTSPMYEMSTLIDYGRYLQRVEPIFLFIWIISSLISSAIIFYSFVWLFCKAFRIQDRRPIIIGSSAILFLLSYMHKGITTVMYGFVQPLRSYGSLVFFVMPLIALITAAIRKKRSDTNA